MATVLLIQPPLHLEELYARGSKYSASIIPPLGLAYIASYLIEKGHECKIMDGIATPVSFEQLIQEAKNYDFIGITALSTYVLRVIQTIRSLRDGGITVPIIAGGPHVTALPGTLLSYGADYEVTGEGELTMLELVETLTSGRGNLSEIDGLLYLEKGQLQSNRRRHHIENLDIIPLPARHLLPMQKYRSSIARANRQPSHSMLTSRGCPGVCTFCSKKTFGSSVRYFSVKRIVEEFFLLRDEYGAKDIAVWDDNFVSNNEIASAVCEELIHKQLGISWSVEARVDCVDFNLLEKMKKAGCDYIAYGIECGSQRVLDYLNKRITKEQIRETIRITKKAGINIRAYFMFGLPTETVEEMKETIRFACELDVELASFTLFTPLPGTIEYRRALKTGTFPDPKYYLNRIIPEFNFLDDPLYIPEGMDGKQLMDIHRSAYNKYYFRPSFLLKRLLAVSSPSELLTMAKGGMSIVSNLFTKR